MGKTKLRICLWCLLAVVGLAFLSCKGGIDIPTEFPTPEPPPAATPLPKAELKPDAELEKKIAEIAADAKGKVGVAAVLLETGESASLNADQHFPMQSVYKLPIAMAVMEQVRLGKLDLEEQIGVAKDDFVRIGQHSPLRDKNPDGAVFTIRELIGFALIDSDGTASDVLMRVAGGPAEVQYYLTQIGISDMKVVNTEKELGANWDTQYQNWATPTAAVDLLLWLNKSTTELGPFEPKIEMPPNVACNCPGPRELHLRHNDLRLVLGYLVDTVTGPKRIKGLLPENTVVAHKTGTSGTQNGITAATNDIGVITLPNRNHIAIAVFVSDSPADEKTREAVIAKIAKAVWDKWNVR